MRRAAFAFALIALACAEPKPAEPTADDVRGAIEAQNRAFGDAARAGDAAAIGALYTEDGRVLPPNAAPVIGTAGLVEFWGGVLASGISGIVLTTEEVSYAGGETATEFGSAVLSADDGSVADEAKYAVLWKRTPAGWRMHRDIWNSNRPSPPPAADAMDDALEAPSAKPAP